MNKINKQCSNCRFGTPEFTSEDEFKKRVGFSCHRHAPMTHPHPNGMGLFPAVQETDYCGDYEKTILKKTLNPVWKS